MNYITKVEGIRYINKLLNEKIRDFYSYNKIIRNKFNICSNIPIYVSKDIILLPIKRFSSYDCMWINYVNIKTYIPLNNKVMIRFMDDTIKSFDITIKKLERIMNNAIIIRQFFEKIEG